MKKVLLYNLAGTDQGRKLKLILMKMGCAAKDVKPEEYGEPVGTLAGLSTEAKKTAMAEPFKDEMIVLCDFPEAGFAALLDAMRNAKIRIALKAVLTEHNKNWSSVKLHNELVAEHEFMRTSGGKQKAHK